MKASTIIANGRVQTLCRMCENRCSIKVHIRRGVMTEVSPAPGNPANDGRICPRGEAAIDVFYHPQRIRTPLKRNAYGTFEPVSREQALDEIAGRLEKIRREYEPRSVGFWKGEALGFQQQEQYVRRFAHAFGSPNYFSNDSSCFNGRFLGNYLVTGFWNPFPDYTKARLILLFGTNPPVCHPPFMAEFADAREHDAHLVVVDPRLNPVACYADIFAQPYPGTDGALAWGLIHQLIQDDGYDKAFVDRFCVGFDEIAAYAKRFTPSHVERESGVYADVVVEIARMLRESRPHISLYMGAGLEHHDNGVNNVRTLVILACLCGAIDNECGLRWPEPPALRDLTLYDRVPLGDRSPIGAERFPVLYDIRKECHTMTAMDHMLGKGDYPLKGLVVTGANPAVTNPDTAKVQRALKSLDLLVVNDLFMTRTARLAHYVLPAATFLERSELHYNTKYQRLYLTPRVAAVAGIEDEYALWRDLARRLGLAERWFPWADEDQVNRWLLEPTGLSIRQLRDHPAGLPYRPVRYGKHLHRPLPTTSGKIELVSRYLNRFGLPAIPEYRRPYHLRRPLAQYPLLLTTGARMTLFYHSRHQNIERFRQIHRHPEMEIHPDDAKALGIRNEEKVRLVSQRGAIEIRARIVHPSELRRGVVEVYHGWEELPVNTLTFDDVNDPISGFPLLKGVPVRIEKLRE